MTSSFHFHQLAVKAVNIEADNAIAVTFFVPDEIKDQFDFKAGQFLTLKTDIQDEEVRRTYSICSPRSRLQTQNEVSIGIRSIEEGLFSNWAYEHLKPGISLEVMPPSGRFVVKKERALHRVGFASGSGITPILAIIATTLEENPIAKFTLVYGNRHVNTVMFNEALQDLKDRFADRLTLIHIFSRQAQEVPLLEGRITASKVKEIVDTLLPIKSMDEVFICGPEGMIDEVEATLIELGVPKERVYSERFMAFDPEHHTKNSVVSDIIRETPKEKNVAISVILDGVTHALHISDEDVILDALIAEGLDVPFSCKAGVCSTCRGKVLQGKITMDKNFTLEADEVDKGYALTCQSRPATSTLVISYDER